MKVDFFEYQNNFALYKHVNSDLLYKSKGDKKYKYTIAIPTYKREDMLKKALNSASNQVGDIDYEILVVDNDPDDNSISQYLEEKKYDNVSYYKNKKNIGMFGNWNRCIELSKGKYITILNDDDWLSENFLHLCEKYIEKEVNGLYFNFNKSYENAFSQNKTDENYVCLKKIINLFSRNIRKITIFDFFLGNKSAGTLGLLFERDKLIELGGYNSDYYPSSDYVLHANYCYKYNVYFINEKLNYYRIAENESAKQETLQKWEYLDNEIRKYFVSLIGKNEYVLLRLNSLIQDIRIKGLIDNWNYQTETEINYKLRHKIFQKLVGLKYYLNI